MTWDLMSDTESFFGDPREGAFCKGDVRLMKLPYVSRHRDDRWVRFWMTMGDGSRVAANALAVWRCMH